jgi:hypothetical protein
LYGRPFGPPLFTMLLLCKKKGLFGVGCGGFEPAL